METKVSSKISKNRSESGASLVEYALLVALISIACVGAVESVGLSLYDSFHEAGDAVGAADFGGH